jgi:type III pantothenate kinase
MSMLSVFADLGNSRLKWARIVNDGSLEVIALPTSDPNAWEAAWHKWNPTAQPSSWSISTVNPKMALILQRFLESQHRLKTTWFRSAADVPIQHSLFNPQTAGTDRAFAVKGALTGRPTGQPGVVISCGSAITVERVNAAGVWEGGAIAPGLRFAAEALHAMSPQLPLVHPVLAPEGWGNSTIPALEAGVFWGTVGVIRSLVDQHVRSMTERPWVVWSGGDAELLMGPAELQLCPSRLAPSLVIEGIRAVCEG